MGACGRLLSQLNLRESSLLGRLSAPYSVAPMDRLGWGPPRIPQKTPLSLAPSSPFFLPVPPPSPFPPHLPLGLSPHRCLELISHLVLLSLSHASSSP